MSLIIIIITAIGLSLDSFIISISYGTVVRTNKVRTALKLSLVFGIFHIIMPVAGYYVGVGIKDYISAFDHWVAFLILSFIGLKMIIDDIKTKKQEHDKKFSTKTVMVLYLALATSIDALAIGISFSLIDISIIYFAVIVGFTVFCFTMIGTMFGAFLSKKLNIKMQIIGGIVLILIGIKILTDHI